MTTVFTGRLGPFITLERYFALAPAGSGATRMPEQPCQIVSRLPDTEGTMCIWRRAKSGYCKQWLLAVQRPCGDGLTSVAGGGLDAAARLAVGHEAPQGLVWQALVRVPGRGWTGLCQ